MLSKPRAGRQRTTSNEFGRRNPALPFHLQFAYQQAPPVTTQNDQSAGLQPHDLPPLARGSKGKQRSSEAFDPFPATHEKSTRMRIEGSNPANGAPSRLSPLKPELLLSQRRGIARMGVILRFGGDTARLPPFQRLDQQFGSRCGQPVMQFAKRLAVPDFQPPARQHRPRIHPGVEEHDADPRPGIPLEYGTMDGGGSAVLRQQ